MAPKPKRVGVQLLSELPEFVDLELDLIQPNPDQHRTNLDDPAAQARIVALAESIAEFGLQQPILVRRIDGSKTGAVFEIVAGERRYRAHQHLGKTTIPSLVMPEGSEANAEVLSLIENVQREDIDALDLANAIRKLVHGGATLAAVGKIIGKTESNVSRLLGILKLPESIQDDYRSGEFERAGETVRVGEAVSTTALTEFSRVARDGSLDEQAIAELWEQIRTGEIKKSGIREAAKKAAAPKPAGEEKPSATERAFHGITANLGRIQKLPALSDADKGRLRDIRKVIDALLEPAT